MKRLLLPLIVSAAVLLPLISAKKNVYCYFASWTYYRPGNGQFQVSDIDPSLCTHISFAFVGINENATVRIIDHNESDDDKIGGFRDIVALKQKDPSLKVLISMGGWNEGSEKFSYVARSPQLRKRLAQNVLSFIKEHNFDGFDIDWEYPGKRDSIYPSVDAKDFVALLQELKATLQPEGYLLAAAVSGGAYTVDVSYKVPELSAILDIINVMAYDFHGHFEPYVGHLSPLKASPLDVGAENLTLNVEYGIEYWLKLGADPAKMNLGVPTYGRSFTLQDASNTQLYAPTLGGGTAGPYTREAGFLGYNEICELHSDWDYFWDEDQLVPHRISGNQWVGYEDTKSLTLKAQFANSKNLGGMMVWAFDNDDFKGICGDKYPLLNTINTVLNN